MSNPNVTALKCLKKPRNIHKKFEICQDQLTQLHQEKEEEKF